MRKFLRLSALLLAASASAHAKGPVIVVPAQFGSVSSLYAESLLQPLQAVYRWSALNPEAAVPPTVNQLIPHLFSPRVLPGGSWVVSKPDANTWRVCARATVVDRNQLTAFAQAVGLAGATLADAGSCEPLPAGTVPSIGWVAMIRDVARDKILSLPSPAADFSLSLESSHLTLQSQATVLSVTVQNNGAVPMLLASLTASEPELDLATSCNVPVEPGDSCVVQLQKRSTSTAGTVKVARVRLQSNTGAVSAFSVLLKPEV